jgi:2-keto-4-pentenoate hydratase/2-oxohepta-3-ene-1,7-dioic acid hydratase in catechol pathway
MTLLFPAAAPVTLPVAGTTGRDLQAEARKLGRARDTAKAFDFSAPVSPLSPRQDVLKSGAIKTGDRLKGGIAGVGEVEVPVT